MPTQVPDTSLPQRPGVPLARMAARAPIPAVRRVARAALALRMRWRPQTRRALRARELSVVWDGDDLVVARRNLRTSPHDLARRNRALVVDAAERAGATWFEVHSRNTVATEVAVLGEHWPAFTRELLRLLDSHAQPVYLGLGAEAFGRALRWAELSSAPTARAGLRHQPVVSVFAPEHLPGHTSGFGSQTACVVARWDRQGDDYVSPTRNPTTQLVAADRVQVVDEEWHGLAHRRLADDRPTALDVTVPIDVVYLWVDGEDPAWQARFARTKAERDAADPAARAAAQTDEADDEAVAVWRFRDRDELRHSMRSMEMYLPWVRHIYLVTDQQRPDWLDPDHPRITLVDHSEILDPGDLPTFNSHTIGSRLHRIPGLSEHYLVLNDDVFFNAPLTPQHFFLGNGSVRFFLSKARAPLIAQEDRSAIESARRNSARLLEQEFGPAVNALFLHAPIAQRVSLMEEMEERFPQAFAALRGSHFRDPADFEINSWLHHHFAYATGRGVPSRMRYGYYDVSRRASWETLQRMVPGRGTQTFCVNDGPPVEGVDRSADLARWFARYYPTPSAFERRR